EAGRVRVNGGTPVLPESNLHVSRGINAESVETRLPNPILVNLHHVRTHVSRLGAEIIQAGQFTQLGMLFGIVIRNASVVVKEVREGRIGGVGVERRGIPG